MHRRVAVLFVGRLSAAGGMLALTVAISRAYGADGRGRVAIAMLIAVIGGGILALGLDAAATYSVASGRGAPGRWRTFALRYALAVGAAATAVVAALSGPIAAVCGVHRLDVICGAAAIPALIAANILLGSVLGEERTRVYAMLLAAQSVVPAAFVVVFVAAGSRLDWALIGWSGGAWVATACAWHYAGRTDGEPLALRTEVAYGSRTVLGTLLQFTNYRLDGFLLAGFAGPAVTGIYAVAVNVAEVLGYLPTAVESALFPAFARAAGDSKAALRRALGIVVGVTTFGALILALVASWAIPRVFGSGFADSVRPLQLLLPGMIAIAIAKVLSSYLMGRGRPFETTLVSGVSAVGTIALDLVLIPRHGASGAAVASSLAYALSATLGAALVFGRQTPGRNAQT
jgi:O-antigen/teichoic acid export membrane protein